MNYFIGEKFFINFINLFVLFKKKYIFFKFKKIIEFFLVRNLN
jgi:hypothetical protein